MPASKAERPPVPARTGLLQHLEELGLAGWLLGDRLQLLEATTEALRLLELRAVSEDWLALLHPEDLPALDRAASAGRGMLDLRLAGSGEPWRWVRVELRRAEGGLLCLGTSTCNLRDDAARSAMAHFDALVDNLPFDFFEMDARGVYVRMNQRARQLWGEHMGKRPDQVPVPAETRAIWELNNRRAFSGEVVQEEVTLHTADGPRSFINLIAPIREDGSITGILGVNIDTTARREAEQRNEALIRELKASLEALDQAQRKLVSRERLAALGELAAVVAHEVRNPLGAIFNALGQLKKAPPAEDTRLLLGIIDEEATRLDVMVRDLLSYARPIHPTLAPEPLEPLLRDALRASVRAAGATADKVEARLEVDPSLGSVPLDAHLMRMALTNVFDNALLAMPQGGRLTVVAAPEEREGAPWLGILVRDTGLGVSAENLPRIFEPFFTTRAAGTGLGLAVVRRILEAHHGAVVAQSEAGRGSTFALYLPR